jgi:hypothetical protein
VVKICLNGKCKHIQITPNNGFPARCEVQIELDHHVGLEYRLYDIQLLVPAELATLLEVGRSVTLTMEQDGS